MDDSAELWTIPEFARRANISKPMAYKMAAAGDIPTVSFGRKKLVPGAHLASLISDALAAVPQPSVSVPDSTVTTTTPNRAAAF